MRRGVSHFNFQGGLDHERRRNITSLFYALLGTPTTQAGGENLENHPGFTLVEVMVALMLVVAVLLGLAALFPAEIRAGAQNKVASGALQTAQREIDQVRQNIYSSTGSFTDVDGNTLDASCGGGPGTSCGNPLKSDGTIDYSAAPAVGYSVQLRDGSGQLYSVRWSVTVTANDGRKIVLGSRPLAPAGGIPRLVHLQTLVAR